MKYFYLKVIFSVIFILTFQNIIFSAGIIDQIFGTNGTLNLNFGTNTNVVDVDVNSNGKIIVAGTVANATYGKDIFVAQYNENGTLDTTFGTNGVTITVTNLDETITDLEIQPDGKIVLVGQQQVYDGVPTIFDFLVVRYDAKGQLDNTFSDDGFVTVNQNQPDIFTKVAVQPDGKIVAVGNTFETTRLWIVERFNSNGTTDSTFATNGIWSSNFYTLPPGGIENLSNFLDVEIYPDGRILTAYGRRMDYPQDTYVNFPIVTISNDGQSFTSQGLTPQTYGGMNDFFDAEFLSDGTLAITNGSGTYVNGKFFRQTGANLAKLPNNKFVTSYSDFLDSSLGGSIRTYSKNAFVGNARNLPIGKLAGQSDGKIIILANNSLTRVLRLTSQATRLADYDNNGKTDLIVDRPSNNTAYFLKSNGSFEAFTSTNTPRKFIPEYFEYQTAIGQMLPNLIVYRSQSIFYPRSGPTISFGTQNDLAIGGDYNGDGVTEFSIFTPTGDWISKTYSTTLAYHWGTTSDKPIPADYDNDGITDYAVFRPSTGYWWIHRSSNDTYFGFPFGIAEDIPLTGDYDADGYADFVVFRPSTRTWYMLMTTDGFRAIPFGLSTDIPVPGDYDGDGKHDIAVFRDGIWYVLQSRDGFAAYQWGMTGDIPVTVRYDN
jgi:uncharacterized delta-60 repeat protein